MGVFSVTSGAEHEEDVSLAIGHSPQPSPKQCIYVIEALKLRYVRPVSRNECLSLVLKSSVGSAHGVHWEDEHLTKIHLYAQSP